MKIHVEIMLKDDFSDPQGQAIKRALNDFGFDGVKNVRQGKLIELNINDTKVETAEEVVRQMCDKLLVNGVIEKYNIKFP